MADLRAAILGAAAAADRLHRKFDTKSRADAGEGRVDVFDMLVQNEIPVMFRPLKGRLGAFLNEDGARGVLITTERPLSVQRLTAAHELGHAMLGHEPSLDPESILSRYPVADRVGSDYSLEEIQANVFASQLLIPRWLLAKHMKRQDWRPADMTRNDVLYQLSLRLGVSYTATCHALQRNEVIDRDQCERLVNVPPKNIKKRLLGAHTPDDWRRDVWVITERDDGTLLEGSHDDLVVLKVQEHSGSGYLWRLEDLESVGFAVVKDDLEDEPDDSYGGIVLRTVIAEPREDSGAEGHVFLRETRPWQADGEPLQSLKLDVDLVGPLGAGLHRAQRKAFLSVA
jgi:Zn-dependent peptidase ImmA (M78 family)/predicted secreted protein